MSSRFLQQFSTKYITSLSSSNKRQQTMCMNTFARHCFKNKLIWNNNFKIHQTKNPIATIYQFRSFSNSKGMTL